MSSGWPDSLASDRGIMEDKLQGERGIALLIVLIVMSVISLLGVYMCLSASTEVRISNNYETHLKADFAARAGISHVYAALVGLSFNDLLKGPDGVYSNDAAYISQARSFAFRNPISWAVARRLNILNPTADMNGYPDDGLLNSGAIGTTNGIVLVPQLGIAQTASNPYGPGLVTTSRYFVKIADNSGDASELALDPADNPFVDGDGIIIVRSLGVSRTIQESGPDSVRRNSVSVYEAWFKRRRTFSLDAPLVIEGNLVLPSEPNMFSGNAFRMDGGANHFGIGTIDPDLSSGVNPRDQMIGYMTASQYNNVRGMGLSPSVGDITAMVTSDPDKALLLDPNFLWNFVQNTIPQCADSVFQGNQTWSGNSAPYLGSYDNTRPPNDPSQDPKIIFVNGDLGTSGSLRGAGILVISGKFYGSGSFNYDGLILVIGAGDVDFDGLSGQIYGGMFLANVTTAGAVHQLGTPKFTIRGQSNFTINSASLEMALQLLPAVQLSFREITSIIDP